MDNSMRAYILFLLVANCCLCRLSAATYTITNTFSGTISEGSLQWCILQANNTFEGIDTIRVHPSMAGTTIILSHKMVTNAFVSISRPLVFYGSGITIRPTEGGLLTEVTADLEAHDITFEGAQTSVVTGSAFVANSFLGPIRLFNCTFQDNASFRANNQGRGAGIWHLRGSLSLTNCNFYRNTGTLNIGAAIYAGGFKEPEDPNHQLSITNCTFEDNGGSDPILIGCNIDIMISDPTGSVAMTNGCPDASTILTEGFVLPLGSIFSVPFTTY